MEVGFGVTTWLHQDIYGFAYIRWRPRLSRSHQCKRGHNDAEDDYDDSLWGGRWDGGKAEGGG